ncbi:MAG: cysteine synthase A [Clostridiales bacterium]|jgi:cysteine synthase A|nr:cysteine synthase A [Clostridiales bacterium]
MEKQDGRAGFFALTGRTPLVYLERFCRAEGLLGRVYAKLEKTNPAGSVKDRVAAAMIVDAEARGVLRPGGTIVEPTSGNTGIGLAAAGAARGYRVVLTMPDTMSAERRALMAAYGAEVVLTPGAEGMRGAIARAQALAGGRGAFMPGQFDNPVNPLTHYKTTGPEILSAFEAAGHTPAAFVAAVGTGGTVSGAGRYLKERVAGIRVVAVEPAASPVLSGGQPGPHKIQGIGAGFIPKTLDTAVYDEVAQVTDFDAFLSLKRLNALEGLFCGISSGAALFAAAALARRPEYADKSIVTVFPDSGERYLSML